LDRRSHRAEGILIRVLVFSLTLGLFGCGLFEPRDPRSPDTEGERCRNLTEPDSLVENILVHYGQLGGSNCYNSMVDTSFLFHPDPVDQSATPAKYEGWNWDVETRVASKVATDVVFLQTVFDSSYQDPTITTSPRTETRYYAYHLLVQRPNQPDTTRYQGRVDIKFEQQPNSLWSIVEWTDHSDGSGFPTWGRFRGDTRVGF
jgi:hypothetical protein